LPAVLPEQAAKKHTKTNKAASSNPDFRITDLPPTFRAVVAPRLPKRPRAVNAPLWREETAVSRQAVPHFGESIRRVYSRARPNAVRPR
jgi:hypothetical protein